LVMLGMGLTLRVQDFLDILKMPLSVFLVVVLQYLVMPLGAWCIAWILDLPAELAVGLIIIGCCPGGTASNVIVFLGKGNLALSVIMTAVSTFIAIAATPLLCEYYIGTYVPVDTWGLFATTVKVVLIPVCLGVYLNYRFPNAIGSVADFGPLVSVLAIIFIAGSIVAQSAENILLNVGKLFLATFLLHLVGFVLGYFVTRLLGYNDKVCRTASVEVGMQNGGLAAVLASQNFPMQPMAPLPAVFSSVTQTIMGGILASYWRWKSTNEMQVDNSKVNVKSNLIEQYDQ